MLNLPGIYKSHDKNVDNPKINLHSYMFLLNKKKPPLYPYTTRTHFT